MESTDAATRLFCCWVLPPTHDQATVTPALIGVLRQCSVPLTLINTAVTPATGPFARGWNRLAKQIWALAKAIMGRHAAAYVSLNANAGMRWSCLFVLSARARGCRVYLHPHDFGHIAGVRLPPRLTLLAGDNHVQHLT